MRDRPLKILRVAALGAGLGLLAAGQSAMAATIFGLKSCGSALPAVCDAGPVDNSLPPTALFAFDAANPAATFVGLGNVRRAGTDRDVDGLALSGATLYAFELSKAGFDTTASTLVTLDPGTAAASVVQTTLNGRDIRGAVFDAANNLLAIDAASDELLSIDTLTGAVIGAGIGLTLNGLAFDLRDDSDIAFDAGGTLYLGNSRDLYTLDPISGALTAIFTETQVSIDSVAPGFTGLAFTDGAPPDALFAYDVYFEDDLFRYDIDAAFTRTLLVSDVLASVNAGRGDLAATVTIIPLPSAAVLLLLPLWLLRRNTDA